MVALDKRIPAWAQGEAPPIEQGNFKLPIKGRCDELQIRREEPRSMETGKKKCMPFSRESEPKFGTLFRIRLKYLNVRPFVKK